MKKKKGVHVTSFSSIPYCSNSEYCSQNGSLHSTILDVYVLKVVQLKFISSLISVCKIITVTTVWNTGETGDINVMVGFVGIGLLTRLSLSNVRFVDKVRYPDLEIGLYQSCTTKNSRSRRVKLWMFQF